MGACSATDDDGRPEAIDVPASGISILGTANRRFARS
jgi:hypothetical protein